MQQQTKNIKALKPSQSAAHEDSVTMMDFAAESQNSNAFDNGNDVLGDLLLDPSWLSVPTQETALHSTVGHRDTKRDESGASAKDDSEFPRAYSSRGKKRRIWDDDDSVDGVAFTTSSQAPLSLSSADPLQIQVTTSPGSTELASVSTDLEETVESAVTRKSFKRKDRKPIADCDEDEVIRIERGLEKLIESKVGKLSDEKQGKMSERKDLFVDSSKEFSSATHSNHPSVYVSKGIAVPFGQLCRYCKSLIKNSKCLIRRHVDGYPFDIFPSDPLVKQLEGASSPSLHVVSLSPTSGPQKFCRFCQGLAKLPGCRNAGHRDGYLFSPALAYSTNLCTFCNSLLKLPNCMSTKHVDGCTIHSDGSVYGDPAGSIYGHSSLGSSKGVIADNELPKKEDKYEEPKLPVGRLTGKVDWPALKPRLDSLSKGLLIPRPSGSVSPVLSGTSVSRQSSHSLSEGAALKSRFADDSAKVDEPTIPDTITSAYVPVEIPGGILQKTTGGAKVKGRKKVQWADCAKEVGDGKLSTRYVYSNTFGV